MYDTITMQVSYDNSTFVTYSPGGTAAEITALSIYEYELPAGLWWRLSGGSSTAYARIDVSGNGIVLV